MSLCHFSAQSHANIFTRSVVKKKEEDNESLTELEESPSFHCTSHSAVSCSGDSTQRRLKSWFRL